MEKLAIIAITLFSINSWACPDLTGEYMCNYPGGIQDSLTFSQNEKSNVTTFKTVSGDGTKTTLVADGKTRKIRDGETLTVTCKNQDLVVSSESKHSYGNSEEYSSTETTANLDVNNDLYIHYTGYHIIDGDREDYDLDMTCKRQ